MFKYGGFKLFLIKTFLGLVLTGSGLFILISLGTHSPEDPGLGKIQSFGDITNFLDILAPLYQVRFCFYLGCILM